MITEIDDYVPAVLKFNGENIRIKVRLKGDNLDHLRTDKWSFRIIVKKENHVFGMRRFSLQNPSTRFFHGQPLFFDLCRELGILAPRFVFVNVNINGDAKGIMALEEHMSKELLTYNGRRESVILRFDETDKWDLRNFDFSLYNFYNSKIDSFQGQRSFADPNLTNIMRQRWVYCGEPYGGKLNHRTLLTKNS